MKRVVLVIGLILMAGMLFAAGPNGGAGVGKGVQARTGDCTSDCDGPIRDQTKDQLRDGSCKDDATVFASKVLALTPAGDVLKDQDRLHAADGSGSDKLQDKDRTQTSRPE